MPRAAVFAPDGDKACGAVGDALVNAAPGWDGDEDGFGGDVREESHGGGVDEGVVGEGGAGFALAARAVAALRDEGWCGEAVAEEGAGAAAGEGGEGRAAHLFSVSLWGRGKGFGRGTTGIYTVLQILEICHESGLNRKMVFLPRDWTAVTSILSSFSCDFSRDVYRQRYSPIFAFVGELRSWKVIA